MDRYRSPRVGSVLLSVIGLLVVATVTAQAQSPTITSHPTIDHPYPSKELPRPETLPVNRTAEETEPIGAAQAEATNQPVDWWWVTFQSYRSGNWEIYRMRGNGSELARLTFHPAADTRPVLNPGVTAIAFVSTRDGNPEIYRMDANGANQVRLTTHPLTDTHPIWSPDSSRLAFVSQRDGNAEIYRMEADGTEQSRLTNNSALDLFPHWSPDGKELVWVRVAGENGWLWRMNADGANQRAISGALRYLQHPVWSPDGSEIAFDYDADHDDFNELAILTVADGTIRLFQDCSFPYPSAGKELWMGSWSPNGAAITYSALGYFWQPIETGRLLYWQGAEVGGVCLTTYCDGTVVGVTTNSEDLDLLPNVQSADIWPPQSAVYPQPSLQRRGRLFLTWEGTDRGPSGIIGYDVEARADLQSPWQTLYNRTYLGGDYPTLPFGLDGAPTLYLRSRALDYADNLEPWPTAPEGDTATTFYITTVQGQVTDQRGIGRAHHSLPILPAALTTAETNGHGEYRIYLPSEGEYQLNGLRITTNADRLHAFYLEPPQNLLGNGDFEDFTPLAAWLPSGTLTPTLTTNHVSSGLQGVQLGFDCGEACVTIDPATPSGGEGSNYLPLWTADGRLHLFYSTYDPATAGKLYYTTERTPGVWREPVALGTGRADQLQAVGDRVGNLFVAMAADSPSGIKIVTRAYTPQSGWGPAVLLDDGQTPKLAIGDDGTLHLLYLQRCAPNCWESALVYRRQSPNGDWSAPTVVSQSGYDDYALLVDSSNRAHLFWYEQNKRFSSANNAPRLRQYQIYNQGKAIGPITTLDDREIFHTYFLDPSDALHALGIGQGGILYTDTPLAHLGMESPFLANSYHLLFAWSADQTFHLFAPDYRGGDPWSYLYKAAGGRWSAPQDIQFNGYTPKWLHWHDNGQFEAMTLEGQRLFFPPKIAGGASQLAQSVTLPANLHAPTLSWMTEVQASAQGRSSFAVTVQSSMSNTLTSTVLYSTSTSVPWQLHWADMTPWLGQTITVTFALSQAADDIPFRVFLDHVALSEWTTPVPHIVTPTAAEANVATTVVITGENFMATPQVTVGGTPLADIRLRAPNVLEGTVPDSLAPGVYDLVVINPNGSATTLPAAITVGKQLYLPEIHR